MTAKPGTIPRFDTTAANLVTPSGTRLANGFATGGTPLPSGELNWLAHWFGEWCQYLNDGDFALSGLGVGTATDVAIANASQNNLVLNSTFAGFGFFNLTGGGTSAVITGFNAEDAVEGRLIFVMNETGSPVQISISDSASSSSNRIEWQNVPSGSVVTVPWKGAFIARYHNFGIVTQWEILSCNFSVDFASKTTEVGAAAAKEYGGSSHTGDPVKWTTGTSADPIVYPFTVAVGRTITGWKTYINKTSNAGQTLTVALIRVDGTSGAFTAVDSVNNNAVSPGFIAVQQSTTLSEVVQPGYAYYIRITPNNSISGDQFFNASLDHFGQ